MVCNFLINYAWQSILSNIYMEELLHIYLGCSLVEAYTSQMLLQKQQYGFYGLDKPQGFLILAVASQLNISPGKMKLGCQIVGRFFCRPGLQDCHFIIYLFFWLEKSAIGPVYYLIPIDSGHCHYYSKYLYIKIPLLKTESTLYRKENPSLSTNKNISRKFKLTNT